MYNVRYMGLYYNTLKELKLTGGHPIDIVENAPQDTVYLCIRNQKNISWSGRITKFKNDNQRNLQVLH